MTRDGRNFVGEFGCAVEVEDDEDKFEAVEVEREKNEKEEPEGEEGSGCWDVDDDFAEGDGDPRVNRLNFEKRLFDGVDDAWFGVELLLLEPGRVGEV